MYKKYCSVLLSSCGAMAIIYLIINAIRPEIYNSRFYQMLLTLVIIISTFSFFVEYLKLFSKNSLVRHSIICGFMIISANILLVIFKIKEFNPKSFIISAIITIIFYFSALYLSEKINKRLIENINKKLSENELQDI